MISPKDPVPFSLANSGTYRTSGNFGPTQYSISATGNGPAVSHQVNGGEYSGSASCSETGAVSTTSDDKIIQASALDLDASSQGSIEALPVAGMQFTVSGTLTIDSPGNGKIDNSVVVGWSDGGVVSNQSFGPSTSGTVTFTLSKTLSPPAWFEVTFGVDAKCPPPLLDEGVDDGIGGSYDVTIALSQ